MSNTTELQSELQQHGFEVSTETCEQAMTIMFSEGKEAAADVLRLAGVPVKTQEERWNAVRFTKWTVNGFALFCG